MADDYGDQAGLTGYGTTGYDGTTGDNFTDSGYGSMAGDAMGAGFDPSGSYDAGFDRGQDMYGAGYSAGGENVDPALLGQPGQLDHFGDEAYGQPSNFGNDEGGGGDPGYGTFDGYNATGGLAGGANDFGEYGSQTGFDQLDGGRGALGDMYGGGQAFDAADGAGPYGGALGFGGPSGLHDLGQDAYAGVDNLQGAGQGFERDAFGAGDGLTNDADQFGAELGQGAEQYNDDSDRFGGLVEDAGLVAGGSALGAAGGAYAMHQRDQNQLDRGYAGAYDDRGLDTLGDQMDGLQMRDEYGGARGGGLDAYGPAGASDRALGLSDELLHGGAIDSLGTGGVHGVGGYAGSPMDRSSAYNSSPIDRIGSSMGGMMAEPIGRSYDQDALQTDYALQNDALRADVAVRGYETNALRADLGATGLEANALRADLGARAYEGAALAGGIGSYGYADSALLSGVGGAHGLDRGLIGGQGYGYNAYDGVGIGGLGSSYGYPQSPYSYVGIDGSGYLPGARVYDHETYYNPAVSTYGYGYGFDQHHHRPGAYGTGSYQDLLYYEAELGASAVNDAERARRWQERTAFEALEDAQRAQRWRELSAIDRSRLGISSGYWGAAYGGPDYYSRSLQYGLSGAAFSPAFSFAPQIQQSYGSYMSPSYANTARSYFDDPYLVANDLASYSRALQYDATLQEAERLRRWRERQAFEALEQAEQRRRWQQMAEAQRLALGLGSQGFASTRFAGAQPYSSLFQPQDLRPMRYPLSSTLGQQYSPYTSLGTRAFDPRWTQQRDWQQRGAFMDLTSFENRLRRSGLPERDRQMRWQRRLAFQQLPEAQRRLAWWKMRESERQALGLGSRDSFFGRRYSSLGAGYGRVLPFSLANRSLRRPLPNRLQRAYEPYTGRGFVPTRADGTSMPSRGLGTRGAASSVAAQQAAEASRIKLQLAKQRLAQANASVDQLRRKEDLQRQRVAELERRKQIADGRPIASRTWHAPGPGRGT